MEAARLYVSVGVDGMDKLAADLQRSGAVVDAFGNKRASATLDANITPAQQRLNEINAKIEALKATGVKGVDLLVNSNPALRAIGQVQARLLDLKGSISDMAHSGSLGRGLQMLVSGQGLRATGGALAGAVGQGMQTGGFGGGLAAGAQFLGPVGIAAGAIAGIAGAGLMKAGEMERYQTQLSVLLGSMDKAKARLAELTTFAASTPFELPEVVNASKTLQVFTGDALSTGDALRLIGDVAAGTGSNFGETAMWFGRMYDAMKSGRPFGEATMRLQEMGALSGQSREKIEALAKSVKDGSLTMDQAWQITSGEFGRFSGMMDKQSQTLEGKLSNLSDAFGQTLAKLGTLLLPVAKIVVDGLITIITAVGSLIDVAGKAIGWIADLAKGFIDFVTSLGPVQFVLNAIAAGIQIIGGVAGAIGDFVGDVATNVGHAWDDITGKTADAVADAYHAKSDIEDVFATPVHVGFFESLPKQLFKAKQDAVVIAKQTVLDIAQALRDHRSDWQKAVDNLKYDMDHAMTAAQEAAKIKAELAAIAAAKGWSSGDPVLIASLTATRQILEDRLAELVPMTGRKGHDLIDRLGEVLRSDPTAQNAMKYQVDQLESDLEAIDGYKWGADLVKEWAQGIRSNSAAVVRAVTHVAHQAANFMEFGSPAKEGPFSRGGGPEGWGRKGAELYAKGWETGGGLMRGMFSGSTGPNLNREGPSPMLGGGGSGSSSMSGNGIHIAAVHIDARGATDPEAVRKAGRRGVMDAVAAGLRAETNRLPVAIGA